MSVAVFAEAPWPRKRLKYCASYNDEVLPESTDEFESIQYVEISDVSLAGGIEKYTPMLFHEAPSRARRRVRGGDILVSTVRTYLKAIAAVNEPPSNLIASTGFCVVRPQDELDASYAGWVAKSEEFVGEVVSRSVGVSYPAINASQLVDIEIPLPPLETQKRISAFLDEKTAQIDGLIEKKRALLDRLAEKRQAIITQAVTKGLNPAAPMKDSGIDWLGQIPVHWRLIPLKWQCSIKSGQVNPAEPPYDEMTLIAPDHIESGTGRLLALQTSTEQAAISGKYLCEPDDVLYSKIRPALRKVALTDQACLCSADMYAIAPGKDLERDYLFFFLLTDAFTAYAELASMRVAMPKVNREALGSFPLPKPPIEEQKDIVTFIHDNLRKLDGAIGAVKESAARLGEYRLAIITAAVTGQLEI
ncbi:restriction endonuclease subunit S [Tistrella mobilis]